MALALREAGPRGMKVVVADGAAHARSALHLLLEQHATVTCVTELASGEQVVAELKRSTPDVLFVDSQIPGVDLGCLLRVARKTHPRLRVVVLSSRPEERDRALAAGADAFVSKGDDPEGLYALLSPDGDQPI